MGPFWGVSYMVTSEFRTATKHPQKWNMVIYSEELLQDPPVRFWPGPACTLLKDSWAGLGVPATTLLNPSTGPAHLHLSQPRGPALAWASLSHTSSHPEWRGCPGWRGPLGPDQPTCHHGQITREQPKWGSPLKYRQMQKKRLLIVIPFITQFHQNDINGIIW